MSEPRALVLVPWCRDKCPRESSQPTQAPLEGMEGPRQQLAKLVQATSKVSTILSNQRGLLAAEAPSYQAVSLYDGAIYKPLRDHWLNQATDLLIMSAAYGLVRPFEPIREYDLQMGSYLADGTCVYRFWQHADLSAVLSRYVEARDITHVWSLLPSSLPFTPYQQALQAFWRHAASRGFKAHRVMAFNHRGVSTGNSSGAKRGEWLKAILSTDPGILTGDPPTALHQVPGFTYRYPLCE